MDIHNNKLQLNSSNSSQTCNSLFPHIKLSHKLLRWWSKLSQSLWPASSTTPPALAAPKTLPKTQSTSSPQPPEEVTSSSLKEDGSAPSARTTTSRAERSAIDARSANLTMILKVCQLTCNNLPLTERPKERLCKRWPQLSWALASPRSPPREWETGHAKDAATTTSLSEMCATSATWATSRAARCFITNNKSKNNKHKNTKHSTHCNHNIAKPRHNNRSQSKH